MTEEKKIEWVIRDDFDCAFFNDVQVATIFRVASYKPYSYSYEIQVGARQQKGISCEDFVTYARLKKKIENKIIHLLNELEKEYKKYFS